MALSRRVKILLIICALSVVTAAIIRFSPDVKKLYYNNYREVGLIYPYRFPAFIKKDSCKNINIEHININNLGDVLCYCLYNRHRGLTIWELNEFNAIPILKIKLQDSTIELDNHFVFKKITSEYIRFPCINMVMEPTLDTAFNLTIYTQDGKMDTDIVAANYIYSHLNFSSMKFYRNNQFNFMISKYPSQACSFMIYKYKGKFYILYFYSLDFDTGKGVEAMKPDELLKILNL